MRSMRILFVTSLYPDESAPQYCIFLEQQAKALQALGHVVDVLRLNPGSDKVQRVSEARMQNGISVYSWSYSSNKYAGLLVIPMPGEAISEFLLERKYDVVSLHFGGLREFLAVAKACAKHKIPAVAHFHGLNVWQEYYQSKKQKIVSAWHMPIKKHFLRTVTATIGVSNCTCAEIQRHHKGPVFTVYNGVDCTLFFPKEKGERTGPFQLLYVGNLIPIKGGRFLIEAVAKCVEQGLDVECTFIGSGSERLNFEATVMEKGLSDRVRFLGTLSYPEVARKMKEADMFILPSFFEAFGCVFVEAMASGVLTCGCTGGGAQEIIAHGENGLLIEKKSAESIAAAIKFAIDNPEKADDMVRCGIERAKEFGWVASAQSLEGLYKKFVR